MPKHPVFIMEFVVASSDGDFMSPFIFPQNSDEKTEAYTICLEKLGLLKIEKVAAEMYGVGRLSVFK